MAQETAQRQPRVGELARKEFSQQQINVIRQTVAKDATDAELGMFLEVAARYQLDPFTKQVFFVKIPGRDGNPPSTAIIVGRDGLNAIAHRHPAYEGLNSDVVRENDGYQVIRATPGKNAEDEGATDIGGGRWLVHTYEGHHRQRGEVVGAWAVARRKDREPYFFYAPLEDYMPENPQKRSPWAKGQVSVMIQKVAITSSLRIQFEITGLYGEEEMSKVIETQYEPVKEGIDWGEDEQLAARLRQLADAANAIRADAYTDAKLKLLLNGKTQGQREQIAHDMEVFIHDSGGEVPEPPEVIEIGEVVETEEEQEPAEDIPWPDAEEPEPAEEGKERLFDEGAVDDSRPTS